jgi:hypothetical protein
MLFHVVLSPCPVCARLLAPPASSCILWFI